VSAKSATAWSVFATVCVGTKYAATQGCASCYTTAAAGGTQTVHALRNGIVVLLVPPALIFVGLMIVVRRWRSTADADPRLPHRNGSVDFDSLL
jgi:hypothetical protein